MAVWNIVLLIARFKAKEGTNWAEGRSCSRVELLAGAGPLTVTKLFRIHSYGNGKQLNSLLNLKSIWKVSFNILISGGAKDAMARLGRA